MTERMLNKYQVQEQVGLHFNTITKKSKLGEFPKFIKMNNQKFWREADVDKWISTQFEGASIE